MSKTVINLAEIQKALSSLDHINAVDIDDITWVGLDGKEVSVPQEMINDWRVVELNNSTFASFLLQNNYA